MILKKICKRLVIVLFFSSVLIHKTSAQNKIVTRENQQWLQYYNETKLNKNWTLLADASHRWKDDFNESSQFIVRSALGYTIKQNFRISAGFAYSGFYSQDTLNRMEYRPHQELVFTNTLNNIKINHRLRVEERFFNPLNDSNNTFNFRFRYSFAVSFTLFKLSKTNPESLFLLRINDEIFINSGKQTVNKTFDQNRFVVSPTFQLNKSLSISPTWNSQYASTSTSGTYRQTNVFWLQIRHNLDLSKSNKTE
ncbi:DUF2490 domain-containing protein [Confluentibacter citreus]|uniref:DUF2490 domain-containing protein n=1 Tax=Confluentibacter citreus TaxID=2007307 RepID=UPI0012FE4837|nr:DUF2490 domain-containing protein [Confluentibacter citreus]